MNNLNRDSFALLRVIEMSGEDRWKQGSTAANSDVTVKTFVDWLFRHGHFDFAVYSAAREGVLSSVFANSTPKFPSVLLNSATARNRIDADLHRILKGFTVAFGTKAITDSVCSYFVDRGYTSRKKNLEVEGFLQAAWNRPELEDAIRVAVRLGATSFCCFAHDADPVYLFALAVD